MKTNNIEVTKEHLEGLQKTITNVRKWIAEGEILVADVILEGLEGNLKQNLREAL